MIANALVVHEVMGGWDGSSVLPDTREHPFEDVSMCILYLL